MRASMIRSAIPSGARMNPPTQRSRLREGLVLRVQIQRSQNGLYQLASNPRGQRLTATMEFQTTSLVYLYISIHSPINLVLIPAKHREIMSADARLTMSRKNPTAVHVILLGEVEFWIKVARLQH